MNVRFYVSTVVLLRMKVFWDAAVLRLLTFKNRASYI